MSRIDLARGLRRRRERRRFARLGHRPTELVIEGRQYLTRDWSLGGFQIADFGAETSPGDRVSGTHHGRAAREPGAFVAEVVWVDERRRSGLRFLELDGVSLA